MFKKDVFRSRLTHLRESKGLSMRRLAKTIGLSQSAIGQFEKGASLPALDTLTALAKFFGVSTDYLLGITDFPRPIPPHIQEIINQATNPSELLEVLGKINQANKEIPPDQGKLEELTRGLDEESMQELHRFIKYLYARQTLSPDNDESSAGLDGEESGEK